MNIHPSIYDHPSSYPSIKLSIHQVIHSLRYPSINLSINPSIHHSHHSQPSTAGAIDHHTRFPSLPISNLSACVQMREGTRRWRGEFDLEWAYEGGIQL